MEAGAKRAAADAPDDAGAADKLRRVGEEGAAEGAVPVVQQRRSCLHEVVYPAGWTEEQIRAAEQIRGPEKPAKEYPFPLDAFQATSVDCLERKQSVLVSAHTSAGKTVVAEYAFAMALRDGQRVVYTSPLKALSNQKFREFTDEFGDVGLMTGDVTINPNATCLVMTTEVLRSMLYRGSEVIREAAMIIFDEIHYIRDPERGVVWEECIVLMPDSVRYVFLSATIPNAREFSEWVANAHRQPVNVVYTDYRPTPLEHYLFPAGDSNIYLVVDKETKFREDNFQKAIGFIAANSGAAAASRDQKQAARDGKKDQAAQGPSDIFKLVRMLMERNYDPVIIFSFSKRECETLSLQMNKLDLTSPDEKKVIDTIFNNAMDALNDDDRRLPQVVHMLPLLRRGIGVHHSGLLPIIKEVIEILFQEGLLRCLFATETFSTGLNMPARTVVFTSARKFDGAAFRWVSSGEYIQMSGRAGRRGLDDKGVVVLMLDEKMEPAIAKEMVQGKPDALYSAFHLTYAMILNLVRSETASPEALMRASFRQFQTERALPQLRARMDELEKALGECSVQEEELVADYHFLQEQREVLCVEQRAVLNVPAHAMPFLQPGRVCKVCRRPPGVAASAAASTSASVGGAAADDDDDAADGADEPGVFSHDDENREGAWVWGVVVNFERIGGSEGARAVYAVDVLVRAEDAAGSSKRGAPMPALLPIGAKGGAPRVVQVPLEQLDRLSKLRIYMDKDMRPQEARNKAATAVAEVLRRFPDGVPLLDPESDMKIDNATFRKLVRRIETLEGMLAAHKVAKADDLPERLAALRRKRRLAERAKLAGKKVKEAQTLILKDDLKARKRVLTRLGFVSEDGVVQLKGRLAAEITTCDELVATEMMVNGLFTDLPPEGVVALVSCLIWRERAADSKLKLRDEHAAAYGRLREIARRVGKVAADCKMPLDVEEYVDSFRSDLMEAAFAWARGAKFGDVQKMSGVFEGSLIRAVRRLEEALRQLEGAAAAAGEAQLAAKFHTAGQSVKRDVVFAASLFL